MPHARCMPGVQLRESGLSPPPSGLSHGLLGECKAGTEFQVTKPGLGTALAASGDRIDSDKTKLSREKRRVGSLGPESPAHLRGGGRAASPQEAGVGVS